MIVRDNDYNLVSVTSNNALKTVHNASLSPDGSYYCSVAGLTLASANLFAFFNNSPNVECIIHNINIGFRSTVGNTSASLVMTLTRMITVNSTLTRTNTPVSKKSYFSMSRETESVADIYAMPTLGGSGANDPHPFYSLIFTHPGSVKTLSNLNFTARSNHEIFIEPLGGLLIEVAAFTTLGTDAVNGTADIIWTERR